MTTWGEIHRWATSNDGVLEVRAMISTCTLLREEGFPPIATWSEKKMAALAAVERLFQRWPGVVRDLSRFADAARN